MHYYDKITAYAKIYGSHLAPNIYGNIFLTMYQVAPKYMLNCGGYQIMNQPRMD